MSRLIQWEANTNVNDHWRNNADTTSMLTRFGESFSDTATEQDLLHSIL